MSVAIEREHAYEAAKKAGRAPFKVADLALAEWGRIDILVNNAGICPITAVEAISLDEWNRVIAVNLTGASLCSQAVIPAMRAQRCGKIVSIASSAGQMGGLSPFVAMIGLVMTIGSKRA